MRIIIKIVNNSSISPQRKVHIYWNYFDAWLYLLHIFSWKNIVFFTLTRAFTHGCPGTSTCLNQALVFYVMSCLLYRINVFLHYYICIQNIFCESITMQFHMNADTTGSMKQFKTCIIWKNRKTPSNARKNKGWVLYYCNIKRVIWIKTIWKLQSCIR